MKNQKVQHQQVKSRPPKGWLFLFGIGLCLCLFLSGCTKTHQDEAVLIEESYGSGSSLGEQEEAESSVTESSAADISEIESSAESPSESVESFLLTVRPGEYLIQILEDLSAQLTTDEREISVQELMMIMDEIQEGEKGFLFQKAGDLSMTAFSGEGYIAPGEYLISHQESNEQIMERLLSSWDHELSSQTLVQIEESGMSFHEVLTMASIIEFESSQTEDDSVKNLVASVIDNRLSSDTPLEMDVTVFYLEEGFLPYKDPMDYEMTYDTYEASALPPGPIGSPSAESILAALDPADTDYFFFIYDEEGNYYFASDYETHLTNVETYLGD